MGTVFTQDRNTAIVLGGAHTLAFTDENLVGDPLEKQSFEGVNFKHNEVGLRESYGPQSLKIV
jgi:hypothetical protein